MSKVIFTLFIFLLIANLSTAQIQREDIVIAQSLFTKTKKALVSEYMGIDLKERTFWTLYDAYEVDRKVIADERYNLLREYGEQYLILDDDMATHLANRFMENTSKTEALNRRYFRKFKRLIGGLQAATLFQIELYIQTAMQASTLTQIPIIGELQKMEKLRHQASQL